MRIAYADPPYLGCAKFYEHPQAAIYDTTDGHLALIHRLCDEFPDGWAYSLHVPSLRVLLPLFPDDVRICAWVKPFASFKPNVRRAYAWEPVIVRGGRALTREEPTIRDWVAANITLRKGVVGAKPVEFCEWMFRFLGLQPDDEFVDLFPGSGSVSRAWAMYSGIPVPSDLFADLSLAEGESP